MLAQPGWTMSHIFFILIEIQSRFTGFEINSTEMSNYFQVIMLPINLKIKINEQMGYDSLWQVIVTRTFKNALIVFEITAPDVRHILIDLFCTR